MVTMHIADVGKCGDGAHTNAVRSRPSSWQETMFPTIVELMAAVIIMIRMRGIIIIGLVPRIRSRGRHAPLPRARALPPQNCRRVDVRISGHLFDRIPRFGSPKIKYNAMRPRAPLFPIISLRKSS